MAEEIPVTQARAEFADLVNRVGYGGERIVVTRHGKPLAAIVSAADFEQLQQLDAGQVPGTVVHLPTTQTYQVNATERRMDIAASDRTHGPTA